MSVLLRSLSDVDILSRIRDLVVRERKLTLLLLLHLNEVERRQLHLKQGYSSMFDYCTSGLRYSEPAAVRRIRTARCIARFPEVYALLETNQVTLTTVTRVSRILTVANKETLLARVLGRSQREVEAIIAEYDPRAMPRDVVRPVVVRLPAASGALALGAASSLVAHGAASLPFARQLPSGNDARARDGISVNDKAASRADAPTMDRACENSAYRRCDGDSHPTGENSPFVTDKRVQFRFTASEAFQRKLEKTKALGWHRLPVGPSLEQVFEIALDCFIARHDPSARRERRQKRAQPGARVHATVTAPRSDDHSRHIAAAVKDEVFTRDDSRCAFVGTNGRRCEARSGLQVDHIKPFALGGTSTVDNLRLLCAYHNRLEAERLLGPSARRLPRRRE